MGKNLKGKEIGKGITQRQDGMYMGRYVTSSKKRVTIYDRNLKDLKRKLEKARMESLKREYLSEGDITLEEWFEEFLNIYKVGKVKDTTLYRIRQNFASIKKSDLASMKLSKIKSIHLQGLINDLYESGFAPSTLRVLVSLLKEVFKRANGNGFILINPCDAIVIPKEKKEESRYLTEDEQELFFRHAKAYAHYEIFQLLMTTGLRVGEALGLKWKDIDFEKKTIKINRTLHYNKTNDEEQCHFFFTTPKTDTSDREVPMLLETEKILKAVYSLQMENKAVYKNKWIQEEGFEDMVFTTKCGAPIRYGDVNRTIKTIVNKINVIEDESAKFEKRSPIHFKPFSPHCFRHSFVTRCREHGVASEMVQLYVGHSNKEMSEYYNHQKIHIDLDMMERVSFKGVV